MKRSSRAGSSSSPKKRGSRKQTPAHPTPTTRQLRRLAADIARVGQTPPPGGEPITHVQVEELLAWYVSDERAGKNVTQLYPAVAQHLASCSRCQASYDLLKLAFQEPSDSRGVKLSDLAARLPFLAPPEQAPWFVERPSQLLGPDDRVRILLSTAYLRSRLAPSTAPTYRGESETDESLLLADALTLGEHRVDVQVWLRRQAPDSDRVQVRVVVMSPSPLPEPLQLRLQWGDQQVVSVLQGGEALFKNLAAPDFSRYTAAAPSRDFSLALEPPT